MRKMTTEQHKNNKTKPAQMSGFFICLSVATDFTIHVYLQLTNLQIISESCKITALCLQAQQVLC